MRPVSYQEYLASLEKARQERASAVNQQATPSPVQQQPVQQQQGGGTGALIGTGLGAYGAYKGLSSLFGGGGSLATPGNVINSSIATPTGVTGTVVPETAGFMGTAAPILGGIAALHGGYGLAKNFGKGDTKRGALSGAETGAGIGTMIAPGIGTLVGGGIGLLGGGLLGSIKTGKHEDQIDRDRVRSGLQQAGVLDDKFNITLADGSKYNIGVDGRGTNAGGGRAYNVDEKNQYSAQAAGWGKPLALVMTNGNAKLSSDFGGYLANAAMSNATSMEGVRANMLNFMKNLKMTPSSVIAKLNEMGKAGMITKEELAAYTNAIHTMVKGDPKLYVNGPVNIPQTGSKAPVANPAAPTNPTGAPPIDNSKILPWDRNRTKNVDPGFSRNIR